MKRTVLTFVLGLATAALCYATHQRSVRASESDGLRARITLLCEDDSLCRQAIVQHFDRCFDSHYELGVGLDAPAFSNCFNPRARREVMDEMGTLITDH